MKRNSQQSWITTRLMVMLGCAIMLSGCFDDLPEEEQDVPEEFSTTPTSLQIISIAEWAGQIDPINTSFGDERLDVGGAAHLASWWAGDIDDEPNTLIVAAGDSFGISPPIASFFAEEPAVVALGLMGLDADTVGNHNFDRGIEHLQRMIDSSDYQYLAANLTNVPQNIRGVAPYMIRNVGGIPVAVIGVTDPEAPTVVFPGSFGTMSATDPVVAAIEARDLAEAAGATVFVVLAHLWTEEDGSATGPVIDFARALQQERPGGFHLVIADSADLATVCNVAEDGTANCQTSPSSALEIDVTPTAPGLTIVQNRSRGRTYNKTQLTVIPATGELQAKSTSFVVPSTAEVTPDAGVVSALDPFYTELAQTFDEPIGIAEAPFDIGEDSELVRSQENPLGNLIADAIRVSNDTNIAVMNAGGIRSAWPSGYEPLDSSLSRSTPPFDIVIGDVDAALPFINLVVVQEVTGDEIWDMLENSVSEIPDGSFLQVSGLRFWYDGTGVMGAKVCAIQLDDGTSIPRDTTRYSLGTIDYLAQGGDGYLSLTNDQGRAREALNDVVIRHVQSFSSMQPDQFVDPQTPRIIDVNGQLDQCPAAGAD